MAHTLSPYILLNGLGLIAGLFLLDQALERWASECRDSAYVLFVFSMAVGWFFAHLLDGAVTAQSFARAGFTYFGGLLGGGAFFIVASLWKLRGDQLWRALNCAVVPLAVAQGIGRVGCYFEGCCYGRFIGASHFRYPTQLYEAAFLLSFAAVVFACQRRHFIASVPMYLVGYPAFRFAIEFLRADERGYFYGLSTSQWISSGLCIAGVFIFVVGAFSKTTQKHVTDTKHD